MHFVCLLSVPNKYGSHKKEARLLHICQMLHFSLTQIFTENPLFAGYSACLIGGGNRRYSSCFRGTYCPDGKKDVFYKLEGKFNLDEGTGYFYRAGLKYQQNCETWRWMNRVQNARGREQHEPKIWKGQQKPCRVTFLCACHAIENASLWINVSFALRSLWECNHLLLSKIWGDGFSEGATKPVPPPKHTQRTGF